MYITYHKELVVPDKATLIAHCALSREIQDYIREANVLQSFYHINGNGYSLFIYLNNGDRIDVTY